MTGTDAQGAQPLVAGRYRLARLLGQGGMGVVWYAMDELLGRAVAVKELRTPQGLSSQERAVFGERALREARAAGQISHPAVVSIHDVLLAEGAEDAVYIVMELVEAPSLADVLQREGALSERRVARIGARVLGALDAAHAIGLVHRDVKPSNILVLPDEQVKLVDFGIAHAVNDTRLTRHGVAGSTGYMAPELFEGQPLTPAADLWSLGVTLFQALQGSGPFDRSSTAATMRAILQDDLPPLDNSSPMSAAIAGLLTRDVSRRITSEHAASLLRTAATARVQAAPDANLSANSVHSAPASGLTGWEGHPTRVGSGAPQSRQQRTAPRGDLRQAYSDIDVALRALIAKKAADSGRAAWESFPTTVRPTVTREEADDSDRSAQRKPRFGLVGISLVVLVALVVCLGVYFSSQQRRQDAPVLIEDSSDFSGALALSPDGKLLAGQFTDKYDVDEEHSTALWDADSRTSIAVLDGPKSKVRSLQFSPDSATLASINNKAGFSDYGITLWDVAKPRATATDLEFSSRDYVDHIPDVTSVAFSPDSSTMASVNDEDSYDGHVRTITLWDVKRHRSVMTIKENTKSVTAVTFSTDGKILSGIDGNGVVHEWNVATGHSARTGTGHFAHPWAITKTDGTLDLHDASSGARLRSVLTDAGEVTSTSWGGRSLLAVAGDSGRVELWRTDTGKQVNSFTLQGDAARVVALSSDGRILVCGNDRGLWVRKTRAEEK
ncbi:WD40 repeat domain-containing serine/threonine protein kinase [Streptomyces asiaticus]|uniref:WD40 repeat domain-containing serine/threonine protein kinase n=1 Tax=Streptomyces asiaticus TaxID=114695 RepID=UPI003F677D28